MPDNSIEPVSKYSASNNDDYLLIDDKETSKILHITPETLAVWRCTNRYDLPYVKLGRKVRYKLKDIHDFIDRQTQHITGK